VRVKNKRQQKGYERLEIDYCPVVVCRAIWHADNVEARQGTGNGEGTNDVARACWERAAPARRGRRQRVRVRVRVVWSE